MSTKEKLHLLPGDFIFREGEFGQTAFMIETGEVEIIKFTGDKNTVLAELKKGALFGEMAIIESSPRSASARAKTECVLTEITEERLKKYLSSSPNVALDMMRRLAGFARSANERLTRDAFAEVPSEEKETSSESNAKSTRDLDIDTKKTLREFNDDLDNFAEISPSKPLAISGILIVLIVIVFGIWASLTEIDVTVSSRGKILTSIPNVEVQANYSSVLREVLVKKGEFVNKDQPIAIFDETLMASDYRKTEEEIQALDNDILRTTAGVNVLLEKPYESPKAELQKAIFEAQIAEISMQKEEYLSEVKGIEIELLRNQLEASNLREELENNVRPDLNDLQLKLEWNNEFLLFLKMLAKIGSKDSYKWDLTVEGEYDLATREINFIQSNNLNLPPDPTQRAIFESLINEVLIQKREHLAKIKSFKENLNRTDAKSKNLLDELTKSIEPDLQSAKKSLFAKQQLLNFLNNEKLEKPQDEATDRYFESIISNARSSIEDLKKQERFSQIEKERSKKLFDAKIISRADFDQKEREVQKAQAELEKFVTSQISGTTEEVDALVTKILALEKQQRTTLTSLQTFGIDFEDLRIQIEQSKIQNEKFISVEIGAIASEVENLKKEIRGLERKERKSISDLKAAAIDKQEFDIKLENANLNNKKFTSEKLGKWNTELKEQIQKRQGLSEKFLKLSRQMQDVELRSPVAGTILKLEDNFTGSVINSGDIIATVVPQDVNFHVEVDVDPSDITHVYEGAKVKIMLDALPSQKHGELVGVVKMLSKDTVDEDVFGEANSVYRANIEILENNLVKLPDGFQLLPSMSVAGNIVSGKRSVMTFLLFPIIKTLETSFREP